MAASGMDGAKQLPEVDDGWLTCATGTNGTDAGTVKVSSGSLPVFYPISVNVPLNAEARLVMHDARDREVTAMDIGNQDPGARTYTWDGTGVSGRRLPKGAYHWELQVH